VVEPVTATISTAVLRVRATRATRRAAVVEVDEEAVVDMVEVVEIAASRAIRKDRPAVALRRTDLRLRPPTRAGPMAVAVEDIPEAVAVTTIAAAADTVVAVVAVVDALEAAVERTRTNAGFTVK